MPVSFDDTLVIGVASSALFDLTDSDAYFREHGELAYRQYQEERVDDRLAPGVAFPFVKRLLGLNGVLGRNVVEVVILSKNDPSTGIRVGHSIAKHGLAITRSVYTRGQAPYAYMSAFGMALFLSADADDVAAAISAGHPAGQVLPSASDDDGGDELRVAFDFDGVLAGDSAERVYRSSGVLADYQQHEAAHTFEPLEPGPLRALLIDLARIQKVELDRQAADPTYQPRLRISLVTARNAPADERAVRTLESWGVVVDDAFFLGGFSKAPVLQELRPHIFFDDQRVHLDDAAAHVASVHVPYGVANE